MKIAVVYSGLPRYILELYGNHRETVFKNVADINVYFHLWDIWGLTNIGWTDIINHTNSPILTDEDKQHICDVVSPKKFVFDNFEQASHSLNELVQSCVNKPSNTLQGNPRGFVFQFYSLHQAFTLIDEPYDIVVRLRTDLEFEQNSEGLHFVTDESVHTYNGYCYPNMNDQVAYGSSAVMKVYCETFLRLSTSGTMHPETILHEQLIAHKIPVVKDWNVPYKIRRGK